MIEIWMKHQLVSESNCNTVTLESPPKLQGMTNNVRLYLLLVALHWGFRLVIEQDDRNQ